MTFQAIVENLVADTLEVSLPLYRPELALVVTIVLLLLARLVAPLRRVDPFLIALAGSGAAFALSVPSQGLAGIATLPTTELFTGMLVHDGLTVFLRLLLLATLVLVVLLTRLTRLALRDDAADLYVLLCGATLGMCIMASANHLLAVFLGLEMASVPSYVLVGFAKGRPRASEAALKYSIYGAGASGIMLYGISLLVGIAGTAHLPTLAVQLVQMDLPGMIAQGEELGTIALLVLAGLMITVGLAFKLSAVPFHFWCPDAFEGATAEVAGFLSVASKGAALGLLVRIVLGLCSPAAEAHLLPNPHDVATSANVAIESGDAPSAIPPLAPVRHYVALLLGILAIVTCTLGNLAAFGQTNIKRLLAYSTIAHAGYMIMPVAAAAALSQSDPAGCGLAIESVLIYLGVYLFMNLAAFALVAFLRQAIGSEQIDDYRGLVHSAPVTATCWVILLAGLVGIPPLAGFLGKFAIFAVLAHAGTPWMLTLLAVAGINTVLSLVYYWRVVRTICLQPPRATRGPVDVGFLSVAFSLVLTLPVVLIFFFPAGLMGLARDAALQMFP